MTLKDYLADDDPNKWWRCSPGEQENLFDEALDQNQTLLELFTKAESGRIELLDAVNTAIRNKEKAEESSRMCELVFRSAINNIVPQELWGKLDEYMIKKAKP